MPGERVGAAQKLALRKIALRVLVFAATTDNTLGGRVKIRDHVRVSMEARGMPRAPSG